MFFLVEGLPEIFGEKKYFFFTFRAYIPVDSLNKSLEYYGGREHKSFLQAISLKEYTPCMISTTDIFNSDMKFIIHSLQGWISGGGSVP